MNQKKAKSLIAFTIIFIIGFLYSFTSKQCNVKLIEASVEKRTSGINGGGSSAEYYLKLKILTDQKIKFDSLWMNDNVFITYLANNKKSVSNTPITFSKNDTVTVRVSNLRNSKTIKIKPPIKSKGEALLRYFINDKKYYLSINKIKVKQNITGQ
jgi:hypothetical protein